MPCVMVTPCHHGTEVFVFSILHDMSLLDSSFQHTNMVHDGGKLWLLSITPNSSVIWLFFLKCHWIACTAKSLFLHTLPLDIIFRLVVLFFPFRIVSQLHIPLQLDCDTFFRVWVAFFFLFSIAQGQCLKLNCLAMWCKSDKRNQMSPMCSSAESYSAKTRSVSFWS